VIPLDLVRAALALGSWVVALAVCLLGSSILASMLRHRRR
jgi:hypothetical protein